MWSHYVEEEREGERQGGRERERDLVRFLYLQFETLKSEQCSIQKQYAPSIHLSCVYGTV